MHQGVHDGGAGEASAEIEHIVYSTERMPGVRFMKNI